MEVILLENIKNLGKIGDVVNVKRGHGRNFLIKFEKALKVSKGNINLVNKKKAELNEKNITFKKNAKKILYWFWHGHLECADAHHGGDMAQTDAVPGVRARGCDGSVQEVWAFRDGAVRGAVGGAWLGRGDDSGGRSVWGPGLTSAQRVGVDRVDDHCGADGPERDAEL